MAKTVKKESLDELKKRGLVWAILRDIETKEARCMCYHEQIEAVAELLIGKAWKSTHEVVDSPICVILSDAQILMAMGPVVQGKVIPREGMAPGQMFQPVGRQRSSAFDADDDDVDDDDVDDDADIDDDATGNSPDDVPDDDAAT